MKTINFSRVDKAKFFKTLNKRVNTYFKENNIKRTGNWKLYTKATLMFSLFLIPFMKHSEKIAKQNKDLSSFKKPSEDLIKAIGESSKITQELFEIVDEIETIEGKVQGED